MSGSSLEACLQRLEIASASLAHARPEEMAPILFHRGRILDSLESLLKTQADPRIAERLRLCLEQGRQCDIRLAAWKAEIRGKLEALYREDFLLRAWAAGSTLSASPNEPQEFDCRG